jgi:dTDP-D-glucose 4,6-dehydratase
VHGTGEAARDWVHVHDHCRALDRILHHDINELAGEVINIGTGVAINIRTIADRVIEFTGKSRSLIQYVPDRPGQVAKHIGAFDKAHSLLKWSPTTSFEDGLRQTVRWYAENRSWWEPLRWMVQLPGLAKDHWFEMPVAPLGWTQMDRTAPQRINGRDGSRSLYESPNGKAPH